MPENAKNNNLIIDEKLIENTKQKGALFISEFKKIQSNFPHILKDVRGVGMMIGIEFVTNQLGILFSKKMFANQILVAGTLANAQTIRIEPALTITTQEIEYAIKECTKVISQISTSQQTRSKL